jgi:hypothetical protein
MVLWLSARPRLGPHQLNERRATAMSTRRQLTEAERWERLTPDQREQPRVLRLQRSREIEPRISRVDEQMISDHVRSRERAAQAEITAEELAITDAMAAQVIRALEELQQRRQPNRAKRQRVDRALREMKGYRSVVLTEPQLHL